MRAGAGKLATMPAPFLTAFELGHLSDFFPLAPTATDLAFQLERPPVQREALVAALRAFAERNGAPEPVFANIDRLANEHARVVVTGQQTGLLLGPGYTASKTATAIRLASQYNTDEQPVIPVFWLATQDHDTAEIDHAAVLNSNEQPTELRVQLQTGPMAGRLQLSAEQLESVLHELRAAFGDAPFANEVLQLLEQTGSGATYSDWFARQLFALFGRYGLVLIDPLIPEVAALTKPIIQRELEQPLHSPEQINAAGERLKALGYDPTLGRGSGATNLFLERNTNGALVRHALKVQPDGTFMAGERTYTKDELLALFNSDPTCITPAAGLRPITQDFLLPTALFVVGPGEIRYVAQLKGVYDFHNVAMPLVWRRPLLTFVEPAPARILHSLEVGAYEFQQHHEAIAERLILERAGVASEFTDAIAEMIALIEQQKDRVLAIDPTLVRPVSRAGQQAERALARLRRQAATSLARKDEITTSQIARLRHHLLPFGGPSERVISIWSHIAKFGIRPVTSAYIAAEPTGNQVVMLDH